MQTWLELDRRLWVRQLHNLCQHLPIANCQLHLQCTQSQQQLQQQQSSQCSCPERRHTTRWGFWPWNNCKENWLTTRCGGVGGGNDSGSGAGGAACACGSVCAGDSGRCDSQKVLRDGRWCLATFHDCLLSWRWLQNVAICMAMIWICWLSKRFGTLLFHIPCNNKIHWCGVWPPFSGISDFYLHAAVTQTKLKICYKVYWYIASL